MPASHASAFVLPGEYVVTTLKPFCASLMLIASPNPPMPPVMSATRCRSAIRVSSEGPIAVTASTLDCERHAHAAADAKRCQAFLRVAALHLVKQRDEHTAARRADGMP